MKSIIFSAGQFSHSILDILRSKKKYEKYGFVGILDDDSGKQNQIFYELPVLGKFSDIKLLQTDYQISHFAIGMSNFKHMYIRESLFKYCLDLGLKPINSIHHTSYISETANIGRGLSILPFVSVSPDCTIGDNCSLHTGVSILEACTLGKNVMIAGNSFLGGFCSLEDNVYIGPGVTIGSNVSIGKNTVVGAGSVVLKDLPSNAFCYGSPVNKAIENTKYISLPGWLKKN